MNNNSDYNIFDQIKSKFKDHTHTKESWNTPPDFLFEEAIEQVNSKKKSRFKKYPFFLLFFIFLGGIFLTQSYYSNKLITLEDKMNLLTTKLQDSESIKSNKKRVSIPSKEKEDIITTNSRNDISKSDLNIDQKLKTGLINQTSKNIQNGISTQNDKITPSANTILFIPNAGKNKSGLHKNKAPITSTSYNSPQITNLHTSENQLKLESDIQDYYPNETLELPFPIASLPLRSIDPKAREISFSTLPLLAYNNKKHHKHLIEIGFIGNVSSLCMHGDLPNESALIGYDQYNSGLGIYLANNYSFAKKLFVRSTLQYNQFNNTSRLNGSIDYNANNEFYENGITMYENDMFMETPMGPIRSREAFSVNEIHSTEEDDMDYTSNIEQKLNVFSFAIGPGLQILNSNRVEIISSVQFGYNYIHNLTGSMDTKMSMKEKTLSSFNADIDNTESLSKSFYTIDIYSGISYKLSDHIRLNSGLGFSHAITTLRTDYTTTKIKNWNLRIGVSTSF